MTLPTHEYPGEFVSHDDALTAALAAPPVPGESKAATIDHANSNWIYTMSARIVELEEKNKKLLEALEGIIENAAIEIDEQRHMIDSDEAQLQYDQAKMRLDFAKRIKDGRPNAF